MIRFALVFALSQPTVAQPVPPSKGVTPVVEAEPAPKPESGSDPFAPGTPPGDPAEAPVEAGAAEQEDLAALQRRVLEQQAQLQAMQLEREREREQPIRENRRRAEPELEPPEGLGMLVGGLLLVAASLGMAIGAAVTAVKARACLITALT